MSQQSNASFRSIPMQGMHENETEVIKCVQCGSDSTVPGGRAGRRKCLSCNFTFDEEASKQAELAGAIPESSAETLAQADEPEIVVHNQHIHNQQLEGVESAASAVREYKIPRAPTYVFISKNRGKVEFATKKTVKKIALKWEGKGGYDLFELIPKTSSVKVDIA